MKLELTLNGKPEQIEIMKPAPECRFRLGQQPIRDAQVTNPEPGVYSVLLGDQSYEVRIEGTFVEIDGFRFDIEVRDPRVWSAKWSGRAGDGVQTISTPMPGKVVRLLVAPGDEVQAGQGLVVVEAMKMQNEMRAPRAGRVVAVVVREGATVAGGEVLATIE